MKGKGDGNKGEARTNPEKGKDRRIKVKKGDEKKQDKGKEWKTIEKGQRKGCEGLQKNAKLLKERDGQDVQDGILLNWIYHTK